MESIDVALYSHSPVHKAVLAKDYTGLKNIIAGLPVLIDPCKIRTEADSIAEEAKADVISSIIDRRDVPNRDTALHLAVKLSDITATEMLMSAGADWSLQNEHGWSALQEAICNREEVIAKVIIKHYQPKAWAKWCRRLPRLLATMRRMRDLYMEITFQFESSVIPFISRIAPSDTYKIWKRGANLRADMTLAGFDGFRIQRADQTVLFLGEGSEDGKVPPGSLCMISHKDKEVMNALDGAGGLATDTEVQHEVQAMSQTNIFRPGIDVTQAVLVPQMTWRRLEKTEFVGNWKAKVYDMQNVVVSIKSRKVPGAKSDDELFADSNENETDSEELNDVLTDEERRQLEAALKIGSLDQNGENGNEIIEHRHSYSDRREIPIEDGFNHENEIFKREKKKKGWFDIWRKPDTKNGQSQSQDVPRRHSMENVADGDENRKVKTVTRRKDGTRESEYKKGLRPILWLSPDFPLRTDELLPLLDILANKVKAIRRLRELLTTKLPSGTFPVKVAIPVIPTIRVLVTFTKFEELEPLDEFSTPPTSPTATDNNIVSTTTSSSSWFQWVKAPYQHASSSTSVSNPENVQDPFAIPAGYTWITAEEKKKKMQEKNKAKKSRSENL
ncbi:uncharacterized protein [Rutidosis leptorrhynchoides]|uniref:uncharacterized protein n=1 Tax=Rutidosis leptorrhynchoides TaxID=125765 RepID=UPI003A99AEEA